MDVFFAPDFRGDASLYTVPEDSGCYITFPCPTSQPRHEGSRTYHRLQPSNEDRSFKKHLLLNNNIDDYLAISVLEYLEIYR